MTLRRPLEDRRAARQGTHAMSRRATLVSAQLSLSAEFGDQVQARAVLAAIGSGERSFTNIARAAGGIAHSTLTRATHLLISKGVVAGDLPISLTPSKERRYRIADTYLRFWLAFLGPHLTELDRSASMNSVARAMLIMYVSCVSPLGHDISAGETVGLPRPARSRHQVRGVVTGQAAAGAVGWRSGARAVLQATTWSRRVSSAATL